MKQFSKVAPIMLLFWLMKGMETTLMLGDFISMTLNYGAQYTLWITVFSLFNGDNDRNRS